ncbi:MAG: hypothetical protein ORN21_05840 [Methylophilaceae bacterium]|nr:hypothetical protein [Methylophilaceae bacterium]
MYIRPETVTAPKHSWILKQVIFNSNGFSVAEGTWEGKETLAIRWNGDDNSNGIGNPQSRGIPTWFVLPDELHKCVLKEIQNLIANQMPSN